AEAFRSLGVEVKREINPELVEQATAQDEEFRLREGDGEQNSRNEDNGLAASLSPEAQSARFFRGG
ncbi:DNA recombination protein RmuC, partial [Escherichia coli]|nr:DNA recombination protein RmuC [Escherichia coli]